MLVVGLSPPGSRVAVAICESDDFSPANLMLALVSEQKRASPRKQPFISVLNCRYFLWSQFGLASWYISARVYRFILYESGIFHIICG
jgi:hypothetical protein